jgi:tetratricopeptide (TPR) repeat protein
MEKQVKVESRQLRLIDAALNLQQAGEQERALDILLEVQKDVPNYAPIFLLIGLAHQDLGRLEEAEANLRHALTLAPDDPEVLQALGLFLSDKGEWLEAAELLRKHLKQDPEDVISLKAVSVALTRLGREDDAISVLRMAWDTTEAEESGVQYGRLLIRLGHREQAEEVLREVAKKLPSSRTLTEWSLALTMLGRHREASRALERAIEQDKNYDRAWRGLAYSYNRLGESDQALDAAERALVLNRNHYRNWQAKADVLLSLKRFEQAANAAQQGIELIDPEDREARPVLHELLRQKAIALLNGERDEAALQALDTARQYFPTDEQFPWIQVSALIQLCRYEEALLVLDEARNSGVPDSSSLAPLRYEVLHALGQPVEAWAFVKSQLEGEPEHQLIRIHMLGNSGLSLYIRGNVSAARAIFEQLQRFAPHEALFSCNLGFILTGDGDLDGAEKQLEKAWQAAQEEQLRLLVGANLGYLYLLEGQYDKAETVLQDAKKIVGATDSAAILMVAYWRDGRIISDYLTYPSHPLPIRLVIEANQAALRMAQGRLDAAEELAERLVEDMPQHSLGYTVLGLVLVTRGLEGDAKRMWKKALQYARNIREKEVLTQWMASLPG